MKILNKRKLSSYVNKLKLIALAVKNIFGKLLESYKIIIILSLVSLFLGSIINGNLTHADLAFTLLVVLFQYFLSIHGRLYSMFLSLEKMTEEGDHLHVRKDKGFLRRFSAKKITMYSSLSPLLFKINPLLGGAWFLFFIAVYCPRGIALAKRYITRSTLKKQQVEELYQYGPQVAVYVTGLKNVSYQINQWIDVLEKLPCKVVIVLREKSTHRSMRATKIPVYYAKSMRDLELFEKAGVSTVLYPANTQKNVQFLRLHKLSHFFINHGESDKVVNQSKFLMAYDKLLVAGPLAKRRLEDAGLPLRDEQVVFVGRPQTELKLIKKDCPTNKIVNILYAPTWEGFVDAADYSSVNELGLNILKHLVNKEQYNIVVKPHPYTGSRKEINKKYLRKIEKFCEENDVRYEGYGSDLYKLMNESDALICDVSSVMNEYLFTLKPIFLTNVLKCSQEDFISAFPSSKAAYLISSNNLSQVVESAVKDDQLFLQRKMMCLDSLGNIPEGAMNRFTKLMIASLGVDNEAFKKKDVKNF